MQRWLIYRTTFTQTAPLVELDLLVRKDPFKLICVYSDDTSSDCKNAKAERSATIGGDRPLFSSDPPYTALP